MPSANPVARSKNRRATSYRGDAGSLHDIGEVLAALLPAWLRRVALPPRDGHHVFTTTCSSNTRSRTPDCGTSRRTSAKAKGSPRDRRRADPLIRGRSHRRKSVADGLPSAPRLDGRSSSGRSKKCCVKRTRRSDIGPALSAEALRRVHDLASKLCRNLVPAMHNAGVDGLGAVERRHRVHLYCRHPVSVGHPAMLRARQRRICRYA